MDFKNLFQLAFHHSLPHKANRLEWLSAHLVAIAISFILGVFPLVIWETVEFLSVVGIFPEDKIKPLSTMVEIILMLVIILPLLYTSLVVSIKRLHDLGHSGWWWLVNLTIIAIPFFIFYLAFAESKKYNNI